MPISRHLVARPLVDGLHGVPSEIIVDASENGIQGVRWEVEGDMADWERIQADQLYGVTPDVIGPVFGGDFDADRPLRFTLQLDADVLAPLAMLSDDIDDLVDTFRGLDDDEPARDPARWKLLSVMQARTPRIQVGLTTTWWQDQLA